MDLRYNRLGSDNSTATTRRLSCALPIRTLEPTRPRIKHAVSLSYISYIPTAKAFTLHLPHPSTRKCLALLLCILPLLLLLLHNIDHKRTTQQYRRLL
jgi:hypothetical protein